MILIKIKKKQTKKIFLLTKCYFTLKRISRFELHLDCVDTARISESEDNRELQSSSSGTGNVK